MTITIITELALHISTWVHSKQNWPWLPTGIGSPIFFMISWSGYSWLSSPVILSWPLVLATRMYTAPARECGHGQHEWWSLHHSTLFHHTCVIHCVIITELDKDILMDGTGPFFWREQCPFIAGVACRSLTDSSHLDIGTAHETGGPKLRDLRSKICVNIDHPSYPKNIGSK